MAKRLSKYARQLMDNYRIAIKDYYIYSARNLNVGGSDTVFKRDFHKAGAELGEYIKFLENNANNKTPNQS